MSMQIMNGAGATTDAAPAEAVELSQRILAQARAVDEPDRCARLDALTVGLRAVKPAEIEGDPARIAFWANLYNALLLHRLCRKPLRGSVLRHLRLFSGVAYEVGGHPYTLNLIEHGVLRANRRPPFGFRRPMRGSDPRLASVLTGPDPRIHFALNCGANSCPPIRAYDPIELEAQLEAATRGYLEAESSVDGDGRRVTLPGLMRLYSADFGARDEQLDFAGRYLPGVRKCLKAGSGVRVDYSRFDWTAVPGPAA